MVNRFTALGTLLVCGLVIAGSTAALAAAPGALLTYKQCASSGRTTVCSGIAHTAANGRNIQLRFLRSKCSAIQRGLRAATLGPGQPNRTTGRFGIIGNIQTQSSRDKHYYLVRVTVTGVARFKRSIVGSYTARTKAPECTPASQRAIPFHLTYTGATRGG